MAFQHWGNWGGPGWSDGHKTYPGENINWDGPVTDAVDAVFRDHDHAYDNAIKKYEALEKKCFKFMQKPTLSGKFANGQRSDADHKI